jgi:hypothetical protein
MVNVYFQWHDKNIVAVKKQQFTYFYVTDVLNGKFTIYRTANVNGFGQVRFPSAEAIENFVKTAPASLDGDFGNSCYEVVEKNNFKML